MIKRIFRNEEVQSFLGWIISLYMKICYHTSFWHIKNNNVIQDLIIKNQSFIVCFWHSRLLMASFCWENNAKNFKMLISSHHDGKIISHAVSHFGISTISGSSRKKTISSLKIILQELKMKNVIGITPDGPKGPIEKIKPGLINLLKKTNVPVVPLSYSARFIIKLNTWDKFLLATPFNKFIAVWGKPIFYNQKHSLKDNITNIENEIRRVSLLSDNLAK